MASHVAAAKQQDCEKEKDEGLYHGKISAKLEDILCGNHIKSRCGCGRLLFIWFFTLWKIPTFCSFMDFPLRCLQPLGKETRVKCDILLFAAGWVIHPQRQFHSFQGNPIIQIPSSPNLLPACEVFSVLGFLFFLLLGSQRQLEEGVPDLPVYWLKGTVWLFFNLLQTSEY